MIDKAMLMFDSTVKAAIFTNSSSSNNKAH